MRCLCLTISFCFLSVVVVVVAVFALAVVFLLFVFVGLADAWAIISSIYATTAFRPTKLDLLRRRNRVL